MHIYTPTPIARALLLASASMLAGAAVAAPRFLPAQAGDLIPQHVIAPAAALASAGAPGLERAAVNMSWAVQGALTGAPQPFVGNSREYYAEVSAEQLRAGVAIHTTAPRALVRLQPLGATGPREQLAIHPQSLVIANAGGRAYASGSGMEMLVTADKLNKAELPFAEGTSAFRLHPDLGAGSFQLRAPDMQGGQRYLINVVEPDSRLVLAMRTDAPSYLHGQQLTILPELQEQDGARVLARHGLQRLDGVVTSPAGRSFALSFQPGMDGKLRARLPLDADETPTPGLWEVQASGQAKVAGQTVMRTLRVAFAVALPVARLDGSAAMASLPGSVGVRLGVEVGAAGRYETRAVLYGTINGAFQPLAMAHAAQWLEPGSQSLVLRYDAGLLAGASGPFELRDLNLLDQGRVGVLQRQQRGVAIDEHDLARGGAQLAPAQPPERVKLAPQNG
ncbi:MAG: DUF4785 domain-containing protein [Pseudomonadota bacterium]